MIGNRQTTANRRGRTNTGAQHDFAKIPSVSVPRSAFNRSCGLKTTFDAGFLIPVFADEALPGDTMNMKMTSFARMATPLHPIMDNLRLDVFFFAVPLRLVWDNFQKFMGEQTDPGDSTDYLVPTVTPSGAWGSGSIGDYFGLPINSLMPATNTLHFRAYNLIWNEWFRDENLQDSVPVPLHDGPDVNTDFVLLKRGKRHDYFTSCLPFPQKGPAVELPLGLTAPVNLTSTGINDVGITGTPTWDVATSTANTLQNVSGAPAAVEWADATGSGVTDATWNDPGLQSDISAETWETDLSTASAATINQLREAFQIQRMFERDARGGTRYTEILRSHFGVVSPDARLQRPEYLGGGSTRLNVQPVPQTSETSGTPQGTLTAYVTAADTHPSWMKSFTEHCVIIGLVNVRADLNYQQNIPRMYSRSTRFDYYWPTLAHLGEQAVLNKEIHWETAGDPEAVFGYQERFAEYRYKPSSITGQFRSVHATSLDTWHLAQDFTAQPLLNAAFIEEDPPIDRVIAVPSEPHFLFDAFFDYKCVRPMPTYSVPGLIDHF